MNALYFIQIQYFPENVNDLLPKNIKANLLMNNVLIHKIFSCLLHFSRGPSQSDHRHMWGSLASKSLKTPNLVYRKHKVL